MESADLAAGLSGVEESDEAGWQATSSARLARASRLERNLTMVSIKGEAGIFDAEGEETLEHHQLGVILGETVNNSERFLEAKEGVLRFFHAAQALLIGAGVPMLKALQTAADTLPNTALRADLVEAQGLVRECAPLGKALAYRQRLPGLLSMFARLGEQTGELPQMLQRAAQQLSNEVQRKALYWATLLEPLLIVGMGVIVMLIVLAVMLPIIQLNQLVR